MPIQFQERSQRAIIALPGSNRISKLESDITESHLSTSSTSETELQSSTAPPHHPISAKSSFGNMITLVFLLLSVVFAGQTYAASIQFDDISNAFPVPQGYNNLDWSNWDVRSPDRSTSSYVKYASAFQYGRVSANAGTPGKITRAMGTSSFVINSLRYACSVPISSEGFSPGPPKACTITIAAKCTNGQIKKTKAVYSPAPGIAPMGTKNLANAIPCQRATVYSFNAVGSDGSPVDILIDNISATIIL